MVDLVDSARGFEVSVQQKKIQLRLYSRKSSVAQGRLSDVKQPIKEDETTKSTAIAEKVLAKDFFLKKRTKCLILSKLKRTILVIIKSYLYNFSCI